MASNELTFDQARARAVPQIEHLYGGTMRVAEYGWEDASHYALVVEPVELDPLKMPLDDTQTLIDKRAGILTQQNAMEDEHTWSPVGDWSQAPNYD